VFRESILHRSLFLLVSLAVGALFGDAIVHLIPEAFEEIGNATTTSLAILLGVIGFLALEKFLRWRHEHGHGTALEHTDEEIPMADPARQRILPLGWLVLISDGIHNFVDGILIGASYLVSIEVGIATTIAIVLHEIPHEFSDFALLIHAGFSKARALFLNFLSALVAVLGTSVALLISERVEGMVPLMVAFGAGSFLYIAGSDLVPELHKTSNLTHSFLQFLAILIGIGIMFSLLLLE
jgi:zinc and cadmium transporter